MAGETLRAVQSSVDALLRRFEVAVAKGQGSRERARDVYPASEIQSMITSLETAKGRLNSIYGGGGTTPVRINGDIDRALGELRLAAKMGDYRAQEAMYHIDNAAKYTLNVARALDSASIVRPSKSAKAAVIESAKAHGVKRHDSLLYKEIGDAIMQLKAIFMRTSEDYIARGDRDVLNRIVSLLRGRWHQEFTQMDVSEKYAVIAANEIMKAIRSPKGSNEEVLALGNALQNLQQQRRIIASWMAVN